MSYFDVLSIGGSYGYYNRKLARLTDINTAVYVGEILEIVPKVVKKNTFDDQGYFKLDRKYIEERTTLNLDTQLECESILEKIGVLHRNELDPSLVRVELAQLEQILVGEVKKLNISKSSVKLSQAQKAANKKASIILNLKGCISERDPELRQLYEAWVDSVYSSKYFLTKQKIEIFENAINSYSKDRAVRMKLLGIAVQTGYTNPEWVINKINPSRTQYQSNIPIAQSNIPAQEQIQPVEISDEYEF